MGELLAGAVAVHAVRGSEVVWHRTRGNPLLHGVLHGGEDGLRQVRCLTNSVPFGKKDPSTFPIL